EAEWSGARDTTSVHITTDDGGAPVVNSRFGSGIVTFPNRAIFRTPPGFNLWVTGPPNRFKDGIQPLSALVETDWMPFTFTMNWKFTRAHARIRFDAGEPYCFVFPVQRGTIEEFQPDMRALSSEPALERTFRAALARRNFPKVLRQRPGY